MRFKNKFVFIVGGSSGAGLTLVKSFLAVGAHVMICGRNSEKLIAVKKQHPEIETYICDVSNMNEMDAMIEKIGEKIDVWVNNTDVFLKYVKIENSLAVKDLENELVLNYFYYTIKIIRKLKGKPEAAIVNLASFSNYRSSNIEYSYSVLKSAFYSYSCELKNHLLDTNIKVYEMAMSKGGDGYDNAIEFDNIQDNTIYSKKDTRRERILI